MQQSNIMFFQSTSLTDVNNPGLLEIFLTHLEHLENTCVFKKIQVIVPNHALANWLKDKVASKYGICANLDFVVLVGPVLQNIYLNNNPDVELLDFSQVKYRIYKYLCSEQLLTANLAELQH